MPKVLLSNEDIELIKLALDQVKSGTSWVDSLSNPKALATKQRIEQVKEALDEEIEEDDTL